MTLRKKAESIGVPLVASLAAATYSWWLGLIVACGIVLLTRLITEFARSVGGGDEGKKK